MEHESKLRGASLRGLASAIDLQHLRYAVAAADHRSFRQAPEALLLRQSTLSRCIRQLEERLQMIPLLALRRVSDDAALRNASRQMLLINSFPSPSEGLPLPSIRPTRPIATRGLVTMNMPLI